MNTAIAVIPVVVITSIIDIAFAVVIDIAKGILDFEDSVNNS